MTSGNQAQSPRLGGRGEAELRPVTIERAVNRYAEGSSLVSWGNTIVHCTASVEDKTPAFLRGTGRGWLTAEYSMLPRSTHDRTQRDVVKGKVSGRASEIQRLIGRSLRAALDLPRIGERTLWIDCDVLQADGGTRTASITGAFVALVDALRYLKREANAFDRLPLAAQVAAVSVGKNAGRMLLDVSYEEDCAAEVDSNIVMTSRGEFVELQGTGENGFFSASELAEILALADGGLRRLFALQREALRLDEDEADLFDALAEAPRQNA